MAESKMYGAQKAVNTCTDHEHEEVEMYCRTCGKAICTKCVKGGHKEHDWETIMKIAKELRKQTGTRKLKAESVSKSIVIGIKEMLDFLASEAESELESNCYKLESRRKSIVEYVNKRFDEMKSKCKNKHKWKLDRIQKCKTQMESKGKRIKFLIENMEIGVQEFTDTDLIELHSEISCLLNDLQTLAKPPFDVCDQILYQPGSSVATSAASLVGTLEEDKRPSDIILEKEFIVSDTKINCIRLKSEDEGWIHQTQTTVNHLVDSDGNKKKTVDIGCLVWNFSIYMDDEIYFCDFKTNSVNKVDKNKTQISLFNTSPLIPLFIYITRSGDLLISLVDEDSLQRTNSSRRLVRRTSIYGEVLMEYEFDNDGHTELFNRPMCPTEHYNGNICVINMKRDKSNISKNSIYGLDYRGKVIFRYCGIDGKFNPLDICCDAVGNILVSDSKNRRIHIIDSNGKFVRFLLSKESFSDDIYAIALYRNRFWISCYKTGLIKVFKIK